MTPTEPKAAPTVTTPLAARRAAVSAAEDLWREDAYDLDLLDPDEPHLDPQAIPDFIRNVLTCAGFSTDDRPIVAFDVPDDDDRSGWVSDSGEVIHLHPRLLGRPLVLHEVVHWLDGRDGHGAIFQGNLIALYDAAFGSEAARLLYDCFTDHGLSPDPWRLPDSMPATERLRAEALERSRFTLPRENDG